MDIFIGGMAIGFMLGALITSVSVRVQRGIQISFKKGKHITEMDSSLRERESCS